MKKSETIYEIEGGADDLTNRMSNPGETLKDVTITTSSLSGSSGTGSTSSTNATNVTNSASQSPQSLIHAANPVSVQQSIMIDDTDDSIVPTTEHPHQHHL